MMFVVLVLVVQVVLVRPLGNTKFIKFTKVSPDYCPTADHIQRNITAVSMMTCSTYCVKDDFCQGFCFLPVDGICLITHTDQDTVLGSLQATAEAATYFIDLKAGFVRKGDNGYMLVKQRVTHLVARNACWNMGTNMSLPKNEKESQCIKDYGLSANVWVLADDEAEDGVWRNTDTGEILTYFEWASTQPDGGTDQNCIILRLTETKGFSDTPCSNTYWYICQYMI